MSKQKHWTEQSVDDFLYKISWNFTSQIEELIESGRITKTELAERLGVTQRRVSRVLSDPGNVTLKTAARYARALGMKVTIVAYDDGDSENKNGPISPEIFLACWRRAGKPTDFFSPRLGLGDD